MRIFSFLILMFGFIHAESGILSNRTDLSSSHQEPLKELVETKFEQQGEQQTSAKVFEMDELPIQIKEQQQKIIEMENTYHVGDRLYSMMDIITLSVAFVTAVLVLPLALVYRLSSQFRNAVLALTNRANALKRRSSASFLNVANNDLEKQEVEIKRSISKGNYIPRMITSTVTQSSNSFRSILSISDVMKLIPYLPFHLSAKDWQLIFSCEIHGFSLHTAYRKANAVGPCLIAVMDMNRNVFVAFSNEALKMNGTNYFGNGECFVASINPVFQIHSWLPGNNEQFILATDSFLGFGGGGTFALWLDSNLERGTSEPCATFGNSKPLSSTESFKCVAVEIWTFTYPALHHSIGQTALKTVSSVMGRIASKASNSGFSMKS